MLSDLKLEKVDVNVDLYSAWTSNGRRDHTRWQDAVSVDGINCNGEVLRSQLGLLWTPLVSLCCKLSSRQQTSVGADGATYWTGRYTFQRPERDTEGSWGVNILIYANDRSVIRRGMGYPLPSRLGDLGERHQQTSVGAKKAKHIYWLGAL